MSATLQQIYDLALGAPALRQRMAAARLKAAWDIRNEAANTPSHAERLAWANAVLADPLVNLDREYRIFLSNVTVRAAGNAATDNDIEFVVGSFVTAWATA
jgi:hypothetical protein